jgi:predicted lysophospholipase L1 biosynthesis ABC-type transport system permease subunit
VHQVIGLVKTGKYFSIGEDPKPFMYFPIREFYRGALILHVRTAGDPGSLTEAVRREVRQLDSTLPVSDLRTMNAALGYALMPARLGAGVVSGFAFLALFLASVGLYGVVAYFVSQGTREIGIRMAIGAGRSDVLRLVVRQGIWTTLVGLAAGLAIAIAATRLMEACFMESAPPIRCPIWPPRSPSLQSPRSPAPGLQGRIDPLTALRQT